MGNTVLYSGTGHFPGDANFITQQNVSKNVPEGMGTDAYYLEEKDGYLFVSKASHENGMEYGYKVSVQSVYEVLNALHEGRKPEINFCL